jgi:restriction system protein
MGYSINIVNSDTGNEEIVRGENINDVLHKVANNVVNIKKNACYTFGEQKINYEISGTELKKLIIETKKELSKRTSDELQNKINDRNLILVSALNKKIDVWDRLIQENSKPFLISPPKEKEIPPEPVCLTIDEKPKKSFEKYFLKKRAIDSIFKSKYNLKLSEIEDLFLRDLKSWENRKKEIDNKNQITQNEYENLVQTIRNENKSSHVSWLNEKENFLKTQEVQSIRAHDMKVNFIKCAKEAVEYYFEKLLHYSNEKNDFYEKEIFVAYNTANKILALDFALPSTDDVSPAREVKFIMTKDEFEEKPMNKSEYAKHYEDIIYQITLRSIHEIFTNDFYNFISAVGFNGFVRTTDKSTGQNIKPFIISILVKKDDIISINLEKIEFKNCFKSLKGISASSLSNLTAIAPVININRNDKRFIEKKDIAKDLDEKVNLALMDWEDFEHLVREIFEKEFSVNGGEVKVTQASRDGGVDAIAFDPDPIRGGKLVIQAKRYTNTVGVSAVRDLYGTILNEGATKGILVTTSDYGTDAYEFAKGKPITLLNGSNLLYLLEKHGHKAKIDLAEAKINMNKS